MGQDHHPPTVPIHPCDCRMYHCQVTDEVFSAGSHINQDVVIRVAPRSGAWFPNFRKNQHKEAQILQIGDCFRLRELISSGCASTHTQLI